MTDMENMDRLKFRQREELLKGLNPQQRAAVLDESRACVVNANVGSGKTTVLISKIRYLHEIKLVPYEDMLVLTFTNKAAAEIESRLGIKEAGFGTFHSVAMMLLKTKKGAEEQQELLVEELGFQEDFSIIEPQEELLLAEELIRERKLKIKYPNRLARRLEAASVLKPEERDSLQGHKLNKYQDDIWALTDLMRQEKKKRNQMSFSDLLFYTIALLRKYPYHPAWIIIDEVQDCDSLQLELIDVLMGPGTGLFAVGDPNQVIYSFRGSSLNVCYALAHKYQAKELTLSVNYRSNSAILEAARYFQQSGSRLVAARQGGEPILVKKQYDPFSEAYYLAGRIRELMDRGIPAEQIAVFYRLQEQGALLRDVFAREGLPWEELKLMTMHAAKGLEFSQVFMIGVNNGLIPLSMKNAQEEEEERRLFFVGMTRAKDGLELCYYTNPGYPGVLSGESRFLKLIPPGLLRRTENTTGQSNLQELKRQVIAARKQGQQRGEGQQRNEEQRRDEEQWEDEGQEAVQDGVAGDALQAEQESQAAMEKMPSRQVRHGKYGIGTVVREDDCMIEVAFEGYGNKEFLKAFTVLEEL